MNESLFRVADALFRGIECGRVDDVAALYADDVAVWHNFSRRTQDKAANLATLAGLVAATRSISYDVVERIALDRERVLQRHDLRCTTTDGREVTIPACIILTIRNERIVRIDEYLDTAQSAALRRSD